MKITGLGLIRTIGLSAILVTGFLACGSSGETPFGQSCESSADCRTDFCVGGEVTTEIESFCSDDCTGKKTGDTCGEGQGKCIADFVSWCWLPCESNLDCLDVNSARPTCTFISSSGVQSPFKVCVTKPK